MVKKIVITRTVEGATTFENEGFADSETIMAFEMLKFAILMKKSPKYKKPKTKKK